ncbi:MAG: hypothetical protein OEV15_09305, partial [Gallionella sp.]|nr:hypothetical protein [Gallionella sp.]
VIVPAVPAKPSIGGETVHEVALVDDHVRVVLVLGAVKVGLAEMVKVDADGLDITVELPGVPPHAMSAKQDKKSIGNFLIMPTLKNFMIASPPRLQFEYQTGIDKNIRLRFLHIQLTILIVKY